MEQNQQSPVQLDKMNVELSLDEIIAELKKAKQKFHRQGQQSGSEHAGTFKKTLKGPGRGGIQRSKQVSCKPKGL
jgi:hypothetical protein